MNFQSTVKYIHLSDGSTVNHYEFHSFILNVFMENDCMKFSILPITISAYCARMFIKVGFWVSIRAICTLAKRLYS